jgi:hypothetical protein
VQRPKASERIRKPYRARLKGETRLHAAPDAKAAVVQTLKTNQRVTVSAEAGTWVFVKRLFWRGWIPKDQAKRYKAGFRFWRRK